MTQDEIIAMVKEAYGPITGKWWDMDVASFERFAKLVAAHEREACARVADEWIKAYPHPSMFIAEAIRKRK